MTKTAGFFAIILGSLLLGCGSTTPGKATRRAEYSRGLMGVQFRVVLNHADDPDLEAAGRRAAREVLAEAARLEQIVSDWRSDSEVSLLSRAPEVRNRPVSEELAELIRISEEMRRATEGDFDYALGRLTRAWRRSHERGVLPSSERLAFLRARSGGEHVHLDDENRLTFAVPGIILDFGGIAKGWCAQRMSDRLDALGFPSHLIDAGGDLVVGAPPADETGWSIALMEGIEPEPRAHCAIAASGDLYRRIEIDGRRYSHVLDPQTGLGAIDAPEVTVVADDGARADALASAITVKNARGHDYQAFELFGAYGFRGGMSRNGGGGPPSGSGAASDD